MRSHISKSLTYESLKPADMPAGLYARILESTDPDCFIDMWPRYVLAEGEWAASAMYADMLELEAGAQTRYENFITKQLEKRAQQKINDTRESLLQARKDYVMTIATETGKPARARLPPGMILKDKWS